MAGGEGTRLRPLTCDLPKPMMPLMNKPIMEHIIELLKKHGITKVCATLQYLPDIIKEHFGDGSEFGVDLRYYIEETPLGTAGSVKNAQGFLDETFVVISGDVLCDIDLTEAIGFHREKGAIATLVLTRQDIPLEYGVVVTNEEGRIIRFLEKPSWAEVFSDTINTGIYILEPEVLNYFEKGQIFDFSKNLFPLLLKQNQPLYGFISKCYWCDIGNPEQYLQAHRDILDKKVMGSFWDGNREKGIWFGENIVYGENCKIVPPAVLGNNIRIGNNVTIEPYTVIGDNTIIEDNSSIKRSIILKNSFIGRNTKIRGGIICDKTVIKDNVSVFENAIIGAETIVEARATLKPGVKVWPNKTIDEAHIVSSNLIWGTKSSKYMFGEKGISGRVNIDITPESAAKLGASLGCQLTKGAKLAVSSSNSPLTEMIKMALTSGILSTGHQILDLGKALLPVLKRAVRYYKLSSGVHLREREDGKILIEFLDSKGANIDKGMQRKIQHAFNRDDFQRCVEGEIKRVINIPDFTENYIAQVIEKFDVDSIKSRGLTVGFSAASSEERKVLPKFLNKLGVTPVKSNNKTEECDLVVIMENYGESVKLGFNEIFTDDNCNQLINSIISFNSRTCDSITLPLHSPRIIEEIARQHNTKVEWAKISSYDPFDPFEYIGRVIEYICVNKISFKELLNELPEYFWTYKTVYCPWEAKGKVIRHLMEAKNPNITIETIEGVKFHHKEGCVLILPDAEKPLCKIYGEGYTQEFAENITEELIERVKGIRDE